MSRRAELEKELKIVQERIDNATKDIPKEVKEAWVKELDSIDFELNNLYDDDENDFD
jgi:hypothetical protein